MIQGVFPACNNSESNVTVSGTPELIDKFVAELAAEGKFAR